MANQLDGFNQVLRTSSIGSDDGDFIPPEIEERYRRIKPRCRRGKEEQRSAAIDTLDGLLNGGHGYRTDNHPIGQTTVIQLAQPGRHILSTLNRSIGAEVDRRS